VLVFRKGQFMSSVCNTSPNPSSFMETASIENEYTGQQCLQLIELQELRCGKTHWKVSLR
jgi:hypothetical protein